ncbi:MAG: glutathione S-transferase family protein [Pseudomonadota bacterium]
MSELILYGSGTMRTHRTLWLAEEMGLDYIHHPAEARNGDTHTPEFLALNPRHKVPVMAHGDFVLTESSAILNYMAATFDAPEDFFVPATPQEVARQAEWMFFTMSELDANGLYSMRRHGDLKHLYGDSPIAVESGRKYFLHQVERMEEAIRAAPNLMGEKFGTADILFASCLDWAVHYDIELPAWLDEIRLRHKARPAHARAAERNYERGSI